MISFIIFYQGLRNYLISCSRNMIMTQKIIIILSLLFTTLVTTAQSPVSELASSFSQFEADEQVRHATIAFFVIDAKTGKVVFDKNSLIGMAPASTQKIITSVTAYELLGADFRFATTFSYSGSISNNELKGNIYITGSGDPTLGSWRYRQTKDSFLLMKWTEEIKKQKITQINGALVADMRGHTYQTIPDGWIWQDIGNYYGAASNPLNWKENQFDLVLSSEDKVGGKVAVSRKGKPVKYINRLSAAEKGTGDNAYVYFDESVSGTIPRGEKSFTISASDKDPVESLLMDFDNYLKTHAVALKKPATGYKRSDFIHDTITNIKLSPLFTHYSPSLDSIIYWFNKKSINLYGEALIKAIAKKQKGIYSTDSGAVAVKEFWKQKGIDEDELNIYDGSGLSPLNRVTAHAQVEILNYARNKSWFRAFYNALPEFNGMHMKSGTINDVKGFCGYHTSSTGKEYIFSFLVNNYSGRSAALVNKMYKVLDQLK